MRRNRSKRDDAVVAPYARGWAGRILRSAGAGALLAAAIGVPAQAAAAGPGTPVAPKASKGYAVTGGKTLSPHLIHPDDQTKKPFQAKAVALPPAAAGTAALPAPETGRQDGARTAVSGTPVWAQSATGGTASATSVGVHVLDQHKSAQLGVSGVVFSVDGGSGQAGRARVGVDYSAFTEAFGGNYGSRLHLVSLPACSLTTPQVAACRVQTPLATDHDVAGKSVSTVLDLASATGSAIPASQGGAKGAVVPATWSGAGTAATTAATGSSGSVIAATDSTGQEGGAAGSYAADALKPSSSWTGGGSTGSFNYQYPVTLPGASSTLVPSVGLGYDSSSVDGQTTSTEAQSSWVGDGWGTADSYIEQTFTPCTDNPEGSASPSSTNDECYAGPILTLSLNGNTTSLVWDSSKGTYTPADNGGEVVTHVTGANNGTGTYNTDYWTITDRSGTVYEFGLNQLPGWSAGKQATNSVDTEPVYSAHPGDPCYNAGGFSSSVCTTAYKWHLDYVKNPHGQAMSYYYHQDTNFYGQNLGASNTSYVRDSYLWHIDYGFTDGNAYGTVPDQVYFNTAPRCTATTCDPLSSTSAATEYPDVPFDLVCAQGATCSSYGPSFFSTVRLASISAQQWSTASSQYLPVDSYALSQSEPATGDGTSPTLWLASITRTGSDTTAGGSSSAITMPPVTFTGQDLQNRVDTTNFPGLYRYRISSITTELGEVIGITYGLPTPCTAASVATQDPSTNTASCYPVYWTPKFYTAPVRDWFEKYAVTQVLENDTTGGALKKQTNYTYNGAAWHYDDNEVVQAKYRTWGQFHGYASVTTTTGDQANDPQTQSTTAYYQGMDGDYLTPTSNRSITLTDSQGGTHTDSPQLTGSALETTAYQGAGGPVNNSVITSYWVSSPTASRSRTGLSPLTATMTRTAETYTRQALTDNGTTTWRYTESDTSYDPNTGLKTASYTHTVPASPAYDQCSTTTYAPANTAVNIIGLPAGQETDSVACSGFTEGASPSAPAGYNTLGAPSSVNRPAQVVSATQTFYDDPTYSTTFPQATAPNAGSVTMVRQAADYTGGAFTWQTVKRATYDSYGRVLVAYDGRGNATTTSYTVNPVGLTTGVSTTNAKSQTQSTTLDPTRGLTLTTTDANGVVSTVQYDALGRTTAVWKDSRATSTPANELIGYTVSNTSLSGTTTQTMLESEAYATSVTIDDALGRVRQTQASTPQGGRLITDTIYDSRGWVRKKNNPYWDSTTNPTIAAASFQTYQDSKVPSQDVYTYDGLGRAVIDQSYAFAIAKETSTTVNTGDNTTVFPPTGGVVKTTGTDPVGRTSTVTEYATAPTLVTPANTFTGTWYTTGGTPASTIAYGYDGHGKQNTTSNAGSTWTTTYNLLGQIVSKTDPDAGTSTMAYDGSGNVTQTTDARGAVNSFTYDVLNRKTAAYAAATTAQAPANESASWVYDNDNTVSGVADAIGQVTTSTSYNSGNAYTNQSLGFNVFGESLGETITIPAAQGALGRSYTFKHTYSVYTGLPASDTYPLAGGLPNEVVGRSYTNLDLPNGAGIIGTGYVQSTNYDAYSRVTQETLGTTTNQAFITNTYDTHTGALTDQLVSHAVGTAAPTPTDEQAYTYDPSGNLLRQDSTRNGANTPSESQCYTYDTQDRLSSAWTATDKCATTPATGSTATVGSGLGTASAYWTSWTYTPTGQRATQTQHGLSGTADTTTNYTYNGNNTGQAHTLTSDSTGAPSTGDSYAYDAAGNMTTRNTPASGNQTLTWNTAEQLQSITTATSGVSYIYDADGQLLIKADPTSVNLYLPGEQLTLNTANNANTTSGVRYLPLPGGGTMVRTGTGTNYNFEIPDPHGTASLTLDNTAQTPTWRQFTPYGAPRGTTGTWIDDRGFLNAPTDKTAGLTTLGARDYDPNTGAFISLDPLFEATSTQELNGYTYAANNPIGGSDPSGLMRQPADTSGEACTNGCTDSSGDNSNFRLNATLQAAAPAPAHVSKNGGAGSDMDILYGLGMIPVSIGSWVHKALYLGSAPGEDPNPDPTGDYIRWVRQRGGDPDSTNFDISSNILAADGGSMDAPDELPGIPDAAGAAGDSAVADAINENTIESDPDGIYAILGCRNSFPAGTLVLLADGTAKPIDTLSKGDMVTATDPQAGKTSSEPVLATIVTPNDQNFTDLTIQTPNAPTVDAATLTSTQHHPFWDITTQTWTDAGNLKRGDQVRAEDGQPADVLNVRNYHTAPHTAYNLTVDHLHTYYVLAGTTPVLVHNTCGGTKLKDGEQYVYRAVKDDELKQILDTRRFKNAPGIESKYFSSTPEGAALYAKSAYGTFPQEGPYTLVRGAIRSDQIPAESRIEHLADGGGGIDAFALWEDSMSTIGRVRILPYMPIP
ncbi:polymorphic toxin-type HINT domain-containing protein [Kitasatospora viridis]|uniref:Intein/RHS repeat-associated protein n=1 Tax=Kitasatospora viridis TaxID=281105 RepID=A0A561SEZ7_9ACTN|nr:polymorphic toxin-type HINT domain-containing protein [Kitasatospora viridis]TWF73441.1 intein/RHS repeat-associated protein [Kitasatospora viridis]